MTLMAINEAHGDRFALYNADCVDFTRGMPSSSVGFCVHSPPFSNLYTYSDSARDMGNCADDAEFMRQYGFLVAELYRVLKPGRLCAVHCKDLVNYAGRDGMAGLRDFPGDIIRLFQSLGFAWHSRITCWRNPVTEMQKTKAHGLLYKQLRADSSFSRQGLAEYVLVFRKWADDEGTGVEPVTHTHESFNLDQWQKWASPIWMDVDWTDVLNVTLAREANDEKHMAPLSLDVIERCITLWSNRGDEVFSPFAGVGSEGVVALRLGRKFIGTELKPSYFERARIHLAEAERALSQRTIFDLAPRAV